MLSRRQFIARGGAAGAALVLAPDALGAPKLLRGGKFASGVISGDPATRGITLWTRVDGVGGSGGVKLEVARDKGFRHVVAHKTLTAKASTRPHGQGARSAACSRTSATTSASRPRARSRRSGASRPRCRRTRRRPCASRSSPARSTRFGYFNAHEALAREDVDFVVNLGDYIYADVSLPKRRSACATEVPHRELLGGLQGRVPRAYRRYRDDASLRKMHSRFPMISLWDDHEVQNDYAGGDPKGGAVTGDPYSTARRNLAYNVFFEQMPTSRSAAAGTGSTLGELRPPPRPVRARRAPVPRGAAVRRRAGPAARSCGAPRRSWAPSSSRSPGGIKRSKATWKVVANEVVIMPIKLDDQNFDAFDAWQGYPVEREALLKTVADVDDVVFITGDYHAFIAGDVQTADGRTVATEFVGGSVSSSTEPEVNAIVKTPGWGTPDAPAMPPDELARRVAANPWYSELDYLHHGYVVCEASKSSFKATYKKLKTIRKRSTALASSKTYTVHKGRPGL